MFKKSEYKPEKNWRVPANLAELLLRTSEIQQDAAAVSPTSRDSVAPLPAITVVALHHPLGMAQKLQHKKSFFRKKKESESQPVSEEGKKEGSRRIRKKEKNTREIIYQTTRVPFHLEKMRKTIRVFVKSARVQN